MSELGIKVKERLLEFIKSKGLKVSQFEKNCGLSNGYINNFKGNLGGDKLENILKAYPELSRAWLLYGEETTPLRKGPHLIPLYNDVTTVGGYGDSVANVDDAVAHPREMIDAGDWFPEATAAIRHYGDSMVEYPSGSILAIKKVYDPRLIINGRNYVIETTEYRITKQLQDDGSDYFTAYSTNEETYPDGRQIHSPIRIPKNTVRGIYLVLGCVTKEYSNGAIPIKEK